MSSEFFKPKSLTDREVKTEIRKHVYEFMSAFREDKIVAMYEPFDNIANIFMLDEQPTEPFSNNDEYKRAICLVNSKESESIMAHWAHDDGVWRSHNIEEDNKSFLRNVFECQKKIEGKKKISDRDEHFLTIKLKCGYISTKHRIQVHFRNNKDLYTPADEKKILTFFKKYLDKGKGHECFALFEQTIIQFFIEKIKCLPSQKFTQVDDQNRESLFRDAASREMRCCEKCITKEIVTKEANLAVNKGRKWLTLNSTTGRKWLTLNSTNPGYDWDIFYRSLDSGHATVGFEDYITGISIRGATTTTTRNGQEEFSPARSPTARFKEKEEILDELLNADGLCSICRNEFTNSPSANNTQNRYSM